MTDYISRQKAIEVLNNEIIKRRILDDSDVGLDEFDTESIIRNISSADVRKNVHGEWIRENYVERGCYNYSCSACKEMVGTWNGDYMDKYGGYKFCPNCGANMRGRNNG